MPLNVQSIRDHVAAFDFKALFIEDLNWSRSRRATLELSGGAQATAIAELEGVIVFEVTTADGQLPPAPAQQAIDAEVQQQAHEHLLIFVDAGDPKKRTQSLWYWVKRDGPRPAPRRHWYFRGQPGDLFLGKLSAMVVDLSTFQQGGLTVAQAADRLRQALDVEPVTKKFDAAFREQHVEFRDLIGGIGDLRDQAWYASVLLNRLMFIYFLQRKGFIDGGDFAYLDHQLQASQGRGPDRFYREFLQALFFEGFAKPAAARDPAAAALIGDVRYLNGGLFLQHPIEQRWPAITIPDVAFANMLKLFGSYSWNLDDTPGGADNELNPDVLGYIFEKYINQKAFGAYYTRTEITAYLCEQTIHRLILDRINGPAVPGAAPARTFASVSDLLMQLDAPLCRELLALLPTLTLLDPACGSGAFLVAAMKTLINVYSAVVGRSEFLNDPQLNARLKQLRDRGRSLSYTIKKQIITSNLFGVDIMEEATEIAKLRLFLALVSSVRTADELEPLPNIDFNVLAGNSLVGLLQVDAKDLSSRISLPPATPPRSPRKIA